MNAKSNQIRSVQKAAATRTRRNAAKKAAATKKRSAAGKKAAITRKRRAAGKKAAPPAKSIRFYGEHASTFFAIAEHCHGR